MRPGHPGYISHREIRRWRTGAKEGLLGVCWEGHNDDDARLESAIGLKTPFPEFEEDMATSSDDNSGVTMSEESDIADPEAAGASPTGKRSKRRKSGRAAAPAVAGQSVPAAVAQSARVLRSSLCPATCTDPNCPGRAARERNGANVASPPPLVPIIPARGAASAATIDVNPGPEDATAAANPANTETVEEESPAT